jgi:phosphosulfolactate synthase
MEWTSRLEWHPGLFDPTGVRTTKPRKKGKTMVIDKGMGVQAYRDLLETCGAYIDIVKIGFGSCSLYPQQTLSEKIRLSKEYDICIIPGGTFLEMAVFQDAIASYFEMVHSLGFNGIEVSDGTIDMDRNLRNELIRWGRELDLTVFTEYGKKLNSESFHVESLIETVENDLNMGATLVTIEGRESGINVGLYDEKGCPREDDLVHILNKVSKPEQLMWETPLKSQQLHFIRLLGPNVNLGNIQPHDILSLECLRRGLRSDTFPAKITATHKSEAT